MRENCMSGSVRGRPVTSVPAARGALKPDTLQGTLKE